MERLGTIKQHVERQVACPDVLDADGNQLVIVLDDNWFECFDDFRVGFSGEYVSKRSACFMDQTRGACDKGAATGVRRTSHEPSLATGAGEPIDDRLGRHMPDIRLGRAVRTALADNNRPWCATFSSQSSQRGLELWMQWHTSGHAVLRDAAWEFQ